MRARLSLLDGDARPNVIELAPERPISIGRSRDNTVVLPEEEQASRLHARVYFESGRWLLRDFGLNGTRLDDARINQVAELADGNEIRIGRVKFKFQLPLPVPSPASGPTAATEHRSGAHETIAASTAGLRWTVEELNALNQLMGATVAARDAAEFSRTTAQALYYQTGATLVGFFTPDPTEPIAKSVWPEAGQVDEALARQLTRRVLRDHRIVWLAEDTVMTVPTHSVAGKGGYADAMALPLKVGGKVYGAIHLCKANGYFSERDRKFAESVCTFIAPLFRGLLTGRALEAEVARLRGALSDGDEIVGDSPAMVALRTALNRAGGNGRPVLFLGEAGAGKSLAAREAHRRGPRGESPFVIVRCSAIPPALLEAELFGYRKGGFSGADQDHPGHALQADDGTLFFEEIGDLTPDCQAKLLRLVERRSIRPLGATYDTRVDVRIVADTRKDLAVEAKAGRFRADLLAALRANEVSVPPLREHCEDIPHLAQYFLDRIGAECRREWVLEPAAMRLLSERPWPANVRQLKTVLAHASATAPDDAITEEGLRAYLGGSGS
jgi:transcriptional regulator with GAF, ATPase, and Fis domain